MSYTSNYNLNQRISYLESIIAGLIPVLPINLANVLLQGNSAGASDIDMNNNDILNVDNIDLSTINGSAYPPVVASDNLQNVLTAGNTATGANAKIGLTDSGIGNVANPQLTLNNSNATAGVINGVPCVEYYKSGRNSTTGDTIATQTFQAKNASGTKTEYARLETAVRGTGVGNDDGSLGFYFSTNGVLAEVFRMNGADNENNSFRPLDMNGNALRTTSGNLPITASASAGTGHIDITAKTLSAINLDANITLNALSSTGTGDVIITPKTNLRVGKTMLTNDKIQNLSSASASSIDFASHPVFNKFEITKDKVELNWNDGGSNQSQLILNNDLATLNNSIGQFYQSASGNIQTILQSVPSVHRFQQLDSINGRTSELSPAELELINTASGTTAFLNNNFGSYQNEFYLSANDTTTPLNTQVKLSNNPLNQYLALVNNNSGTSNAKTLTLINETSVSPSLSWVNNIDSIPFNITSNQDLNIGATNNLDITTAIGDLDISSANDVNILATGAGVGTRNINLTANGAVNLTTSSNLTMAINNDWTLTGTSIISATASGMSGQYLRIFINGTPYKIELLND